jgi:hypothetical protein
VHNKEVSGTVSSSTLRKNNCYINSSTKIRPNKYFRFFWKKDQVIS